MKGRTAAAVLLALAAAAGARVARADDPATGRAACFKAYVDEQALRDKGHLKEARAAALTCARDVCPPLLGRDCVAWMRELEASIPSVAIAVTDGQGSARLDARVTVDGTEARLDGTSLLLDPGAHTLRAELPGQGAVQASVVLVQGEHDRNPRAPGLPVHVVRPGFRPGDVQRLAPRTRLRSTCWARARSSPWGCGPSPGRWRSGALRANQTLQACYGHCSASDVSQVRARLLVADVAGAASVVLGGATLAFYLGRPSAIAATPAAMGIIAGVSGRF